MFSNHFQFIRFPLLDEEEEEEGGEEE